MERDRVRIEEKESDDLGQDEEAISIYADEEYVGIG